MRSANGFGATQGQAEVARRRDDTIIMTFDLNELDASGHVEGLSKHVQQVLGSRIDGGRIVLERDFLMAKYSGAWPIRRGHASS